MWLTSQTGADVGSCDWVVGGMLVAPGTTVEKVLSCFENLFGQVRLQKTPCEAGIQQGDLSQQLGPGDSSSYRSSEHHRVTSLPLQ